MNPWCDVVDRFKVREQRFLAYVALSDGRVGARANRGRALGPDKMEALIWGLGHESPVVRRCCLEFLDQHPSPQAVPHIVRCLEDPVARVRWHAVHALICDACKPGVSYLSAAVLGRIREMAATDASAKVRSQAEWGLQQAGVHVA